MTLYFQAAKRFLVSGIDIIYVLGIRIYNGVFLRGPVFASPINPAMSCAVQSSGSHMHGRRMEAPVNLSDKYIPIGRAPNADRR